MLVRQVQQVHWCSSVLIQPIGLFIECVYLTPTVLGLLVIVEIIHSLLNAHSLFVPTGRQRLVVL